MARTCHFVFVPHIRDEAAYGVKLGAPVIDGSKLTVNLNNTAAVGGNGSRQSLSAPWDDQAARAIVWALGTGTIAADPGAGSPLVTMAGVATWALHEVRVSATKIKFRVTGPSFDQTGVTEYDVGTTYFWRITWGGGVVALEVGTTAALGTEEFSVAHTAKFDPTGGKVVHVPSTGAFGTGTSCNFSVDFLTIISGDTDADRVSFNAVASSNPNSHTSVTYADFDNGTGTNPNFADVDDWAAAVSDGDTTYDSNTGEGGPFTHRQTYFMEAYTRVGDYMAVAEMTWGRTANGNKNATARTLIIAGATEVEGDEAVVFGGYTNTINHIYQVHPSGNAWNGFGTLEAGVRFDEQAGEDAEAMRLSALQVHIIDLKADPGSPTPPATAGLPERSYPRGVGRGIMRGAA